MFSLVNSAWSVHISLVIQTGQLKKATLWIQDSYFRLKQWMEVKNVLVMDLFNMQLFTSQDVNWWTRVVWITCADSHSDGTHSLERIHWWASDAMVNFSKFFSEEEPNHIWFHKAGVWFQNMTNLRCDCKTAFWNKQCCEKITRLS